jgi:hypothetical protein
MFQEEKKNLINTKFNKLYTNSLLNFVLMKFFFFLFRFVQKYLISSSTKESLHEDYKYILFRISRNVFQNGV